MNDLHRLGRKRQRIENKYRTDTERWWADAVEAVVPLIMAHESTLQAAADALGVHRITLDEHLRQHPDYRPRPRRKTAA